MDTSEEYILMCEKAKEIQKLWEREDYDHVYAIESKKCGIFRNGFSASKVIWLPKQGQLQVMVEIKQSNFETEDYTPIVTACNLVKFAMWITSTDIPDKWYQIENKWQFKSMEQLWLAFVMKEKFEKVWDGEDWIESKNDNRSQAL